MLSAEQLEKARSLRNAGMGWHSVAETVCASEHTIRCTLDPGWAERRRDQVNQARARKVGLPFKRRLLQPEKQPVHVEAAFRAPDYVLADRDRRMALEHSSITAALLGDPLPGRSALDKRRPNVLVSND